MNLDYVFHHVEQAVALMRGKGEALDRMDISSDGFWHSFAAFAVSLPALFFTWVVSGRQDQIADPELSLPNLIARDATIELALWLLPILGYLMILQMIGFANRFAPLIIARNWAMVAINYLTALIFVPLLFMADSTDFVGLMLLCALILILVGITNLTRHALGSGLGLAAALVIGEYFIVIFVSVAIYSS